MTLANHQHADAPGGEPALKPLLLELPAVAALLSVSPRSVKRLPAELPHLTVSIGRRRLFVRAKLEQWIAAGCPRAGPPRLRRGGR
jgi:hypothetical protein